MKFCSNCGAAVTFRIPAGDTLARYVCDTCEAVHYENPRIVAGCIPEWEGKILLCRRAIEPRHGLWTLPAGFMEKGETTLQAAARETLEEAGARVEVGALYTLFSLPHIDQVYLFYRGQLTDLDYAAGSESLEVDLFEERAVPWEELAFRVVGETLKLYFQDRLAGRFRTHVGDIVRALGSTNGYEVSILPQER